MTRPYSFSLFCELKQQLEREYATVADVNTVQTRSMRQAEQEKKLVYREPERMMNIDIGDADENGNVEETRDGVQTKEDANDKARKMVQKRCRVIIIVCMMMVKVIRVSLRWCEVVREMVTVRHSNCTEWKREMLVKGKSFE